MSQVSDVHHAVADRIRSSGIDSSVNVFAFPVDVPKLPAVVIRPAEDVYVEYHNTFGPVRVQTVHLVAEVTVPLGGSTESAHEFLAELVSSGTGEDVSIADAITGNEIAIGATVGYMLAGDAGNYLRGELATSPSTPVLRIEIPVTVGLNRS